MQGQEVEDIGSDPLWDRFLEEAGTDLRSSDIGEVVWVGATPYDPDEMTFIGDFLLKNGGIIRVEATFVPTYDAVVEASVTALSY
jgi:hypothetical protein